MIARLLALLGLSTTWLVAQPLETFTQLVRPGTTFFAGEWAAPGEQPSARFAQGDGAFEIKGVTNGSRGSVDVYLAADGRSVSIGGNRFLAVSAMVLTGNRAPFFRVFLFDAAGRSASATFLAADFSTGQLRAVVEPLSFAPGFNPAAVERIRISGDVLEGTAELAFAFDEIAAVPQGGLIGGGLRNFSTRSQIGTGATSTIIGFSTNGTAAKSVLVRAVGPTLGSLGVTGFLVDPQLQVFRGAAPVAANDNWGADLAANGTFARAGAFPLSAGSRDAALALTLAPGGYTAQVSGVGGATGLALLELYDLDEGPAYPNQRFVNLAARGAIGAAPAQLAAGFVIDGRLPKQLLIRVAGPALASVGMGTGFAADPQLRLVRLGDGGETLVRENDDWQTGNDRAQIAAVAASVGAFPFATGSRDAALAVTLPPGAYCAQAIAAGSTGGVALVEVYEAQW